MALQSFTVSIGALRDVNNNDKNYVSGEAIYVKTIGGTFAPIFRDLAGTSEIAQDGLANQTNEKGQFTFFVEAGDYILEYQNQSTPVTIVGADYFNNRVGEVVNSIQVQTDAALDQFELDSQSEIDRLSNLYSAAIYVDTTAGLANTVDGDYFSVVSSDDNNYLDLYKNTAGSAILQKQYPSVNAIDAAYEYNKTQIPLTGVESGFYLSSAGAKVVAPDNTYKYTSITLDAGEYEISCSIVGAQRAILIDGVTYPQGTSTLTNQNYNFKFIVDSKVDVILSSSSSLEPKLYKTNSVTLVSGFYAFSLPSKIEGMYVTEGGSLSPLSLYDAYEIPVKIGETYKITGSVRDAAKLFYIDGEAFPDSATNTLEEYSGIVTAKKTGILKVSYENSRRFDIALNESSDYASVATTNSLESRIENIEAEGFESFVDFTKSEGFYVSSAGDKLPLASFDLLEIQAKAGDVFKIRGTIVDAARLAYVDGRPYPDNDQSPATEVDATVAVRENGKMFVSYNNTKPFVITKNKNYLNNIFDDYDTATDYTTIPDTYITSTGDELSLQLYTSLRVPVSIGDTYRVRGSVGDAARLIYLDGVAYPSADESPAVDVEYVVTAKSTGIMKVSYLDAQEFKIEKSASNKELTPVLTGLESGIANLKSKEDNTFFKSFHRNVLCLGDSLTSGGNYQPGMNGQPAEECYPYFLNLASGWVCTNAGYNGIDPLNMWNDNISTSTYVGSNYDSCIVWLGTNNGLTDTIDADTSSGDYLTYADTNTGRYCSIIEKLLSENQNLIIYINKIFATGNNSTETSNLVIEKIAQRYNLQLIDSNENGEIYPNPKLHEFNMVHFTKVGNAVLAKSIYEKILSNISYNIENQLNDYNTLLLGVRTSTIFDN